MNFLSDKIKVTWDTRIYSQFVFQHVLKNARHRSIVVLLRLLFYDFLIRYLTWAIKWIKHFRSIVIENYCYNKYSNTACNSDFLRLNTGWCNKFSWFQGYSNFSVYISTVLKVLRIIFCFLCWSILI